MNYKVKCSKIKTTKTGENIGEYLVDIQSIFSDESYEGKMQLEKKINRFW